MTNRIKFGKLILPYGVNPEPHERETADVFLLLGLDVEFIAPVRTKGAKTADVIMSGVLWEMKSPTGSTGKTIQRQLQRGGKQSRNIILDGRRTKLEDAYILKELKRQVALSRSIKRLYFVRKDGSAIDIKR